MFTVREATPKDSEDIFCWRNDPETIRMSLSGRGVSPEEHGAWFARTLDSSRCIQVIGEMTLAPFRSTKLGVVRFDREDSDVWLVSLTVNPSERGKGYGSMLLGAAICYLVSTQSLARAVLRARIFKKNIRSVAIFRKNAFLDESVSLDVLTMTRELP